MQARINLGSCVAPHTVAVAGTCQVGATGREVGIFQKPFSPQHNIKVFREAKISTLCELADTPPHFVTPTFTAPAPQHVKEPQLSMPESLFDPTSIGPQTPEVPILVIWDSFEKY